MLVLDNADDARFLPDRPAADTKTTFMPLREYLSHCERGSILVMTRRAYSGVLSGKPICLDMSRVGLD